MNMTSNTTTTTNNNNNKNTITNDKDKGGIGLTDNTKIITTPPLLPPNLSRYISQCDKLNQLIPPTTTVSSNDDGNLPPLTLHQYTRLLELFLNDETIVSFPSFFPSDDDVIRLISSSSSREMVTKVKGDDDDDDGNDTLSYLIHQIKQQSSSNNDDNNASSSSSFIGVASFRYLLRWKTSSTNAGIAVRHVGIPLILSSYVLSSMTVCHVMMDVMLNELSSSGNSGVVVVVDDDCFEGMINDILHVLTDQNDGDMVKDVDDNNDDDDDDDNKLGASFYRQRRWEVSCRLLSTIHDSIIDDCNKKEILSNGMHRIVMTLLSRYDGGTMTTSDDHFLWRPVSALLLPTLYPSPPPPSFSPSHQKRSDEFSSHLLNLLLLSTQSSPSSLTNTLLLSNGMGALYLTLPSLLSQSLPLPGLSTLLYAGLSQITDEWNGSKTGTTVVSARSSSKSDNTATGEMSASGASSLLRRRSLAVFRRWIESSGRKFDDVWKVYVSCFESWEMECEQHLVDPVFDHVVDFCAVAAAAATTAAVTQEEEEDGRPIMSWKWIGALLSRLLLSPSPTLRKLGLYRLLNGNAGIAVTHDAILASATPHRRKTKKASQKPKKQKAKQHISSHITTPHLPLSALSPSFITDVLIHSHDSLTKSTVGFIQPFENRHGAISSDNVSVRLGVVLEEYVLSLENKQRELFLELVAEKMKEDTWRYQTVQLVFSSLVRASRRLNEGCLYWSPTAVELLVRGWNRTWGCCEDGRVSTVVQVDGGVPLGRRAEMLTILAELLSRSKGDDKVDPKRLLEFLDLFPVAVASSRDVNTSQQQQQQPSNSHRYISYQNQLSHHYLQIYLHNLSLPSGLSSSLATNYVIQPSLLSHRYAKAIVKLAAVSDETLSAMEVLFPAIHRGLCHSHDDEKRRRGMALLEYACRENGAFLGSGSDEEEKCQNRPMIVSEEMENVIVVFLTKCFNDIAMAVDDDDDAGGAAKNKSTRRRMTTAINALDRINIVGKVFKEVSQMMMVIGDEIYNETVRRLMNGAGDSDDKDVIKNLLRLRAALIIKNDREQRHTGDPQAQDSTTTTTDPLALQHAILSLPPPSIHGSLFQYAKWSLLSTLSHHPSNNTFLQQNETHALVLSHATNDLHAVPSTAIVSLFTTLAPLVKTLGPEHILESSSLLFRIMDETSVGGDEMYMLTQLCTVLFSPENLTREWDSWKTDDNRDDDDDDNYPIRAAFRKILKMGDRRPHVTRILLSRICPAWLAASEGMGSIPYREDILKLVVRKEGRVDVASSGSAGDEEEEEGGEGAFQMGDVHETSLSRSFVLTFLHLLTQRHGSNTPVVLRIELFHYLIRHLLGPSYGGEPTASIMTGSIPYSRKIRSFQALCLLQSHVTADIVVEVAEMLVMCMGYPLHNQIRYYMEVFAVAITRGTMVERDDGMSSEAITIWIRELKKWDLSLQKVTSLMIIIGNIVEGSPSSSEMTTKGNGIKLDATSGAEVLRSVIPWMGSTQGFTRAIAQLLTYTLLQPLVTSSSPPPPTNDDDNWYLSTILTFLENNKEMSRLRRKQKGFFQTYDVEDACTLQCLLGETLDKGDEPCPVHVVELLKRSMEELFEEMHRVDKEGGPDWKRSLAETDTILEEEDDDDGPVNFQRKILPTDALRLAIQNHTQNALRNAAGAYKRKLIICASLVDKVPNLAGLCRTGEIFAVEKVVIPDKNVVGMDIFGSISVGAEEWLEVEECKEMNLLPWLSQRKRENYTIVGLEQTSSSSCLTQFTFPPKTVLLLGKEKEGIPVEFLRMVDYCVEIPQRGIIRSLNVHVTGAIAIWEYSKQMMGLEGKE